MKRLFAAGPALAGVLLMSACGGAGSAAKSAAPARSATVSVQRLSGVGQVLVDRTGKPIYTSDQERGGRIVCRAGCTAFWKPVEPGAGTPTAARGAGKLAVIKRPDGTRQLTANGRPLYTFVQDSPGKATGDGFMDNFDGHHFTWHVVRSGGETAGGAGGGRSSAGYGY